MDSKTILVAARKLLVEKGWTKGVYVRNGNGEDVSPADVTARCFCSLGAIERAAHELTIAEKAGHIESIKALWAAQIELAKVVSGDASNSDMCVAHFNDTYTTKKADVLAAFDKAIEAQS